MVQRLRRLIPAPGLHPLRPGRVDGTQRGMWLVRPGGDMLTVALDDGTGQIRRELHPWPT